MLMARWIMTALAVETQVSSGGANFHVERLVSRYVKFATGFKR